MATLTEVKAKAEATIKARAWTPEDGESLFMYASAVFSAAEVAELMAFVDALLAQYHNPEPRLRA